MDSDTCKITLGYQPPRYVLTGRQRASLHPDYEINVQNSDGIKDSAHQLDQRFQDLFKDIVLFEYDDLLGENVWDRLLNVELKSDGHFRPDISFTNYERQRTEIQLGFKLGSILKSLHTGSYYDDVDYKESENIETHDLAWGFVIGLLGRESKESGKEHEALRDLIQYFKRMSKSRKRLVEYEVDLIDNLSGIQDKKRKSIENELRKRDIPPVPFLRRFISDVYRENKYYYDSISDLIDELASDEQFSQINNLYEASLDDAKILTIDGIDANMNGTSVLELLKILHSEGGPLQPDKIADQVGIVSSYVQPVNGTFDRLMPTEDTMMWTQYPVIKSTDLGWDLTDYGQVVCGFLFDLTGSDRTYASMISFCFLQDSEDETDLDFDLGHRTIEAALSEISNF